MCCGTGRQLEMLKEPGMDLYGVDISLAMIDEAAQHEITFINKNALDVDLPAESFDAVILSFSLHEKNDYDRNILLDTSWKLVRPKGHLIISDYCRVPTTWQGFLWGRILIPLLERLAGREHHRNYSSWMSGGALEKHIEPIAARKNIISQHFNGTISVCSIQKEPYAEKVFRAVKLIQQS
ncbi:class I SAM-dependent methyltransferase [Desulfopila inferna]|nr:class I SAM-dependent methyltransferase [Desulfopila inferna]